MIRAEVASLPLAMMLSVLGVSQIVNAHATEATISLKSYEYSELKLLRIVKERNGKMIACFHGAKGRKKGDYSRISEHSEIGTRNSSVRQIFQDHVAIEETIAVNGTDWVVAEFNWPVATDQYSKALVAGCGKPPV